MSGVGGIYRGPSGQELYGDGREVNPVSLTPPNEAAAALPRPPEAPHAATAAASAWALSDEERKLVESIRDHQDIVKPASRFAVLPLIAIIDRHAPAAPREGGDPSDAGNGEGSASK